ncbi:unnamed protein product [Ectocarpus sp. CCAP 1310/34]|nr:unnamed protein product [Ectocarpus sp. CCAP 1310/34]
MQLCSGDSFVVSDGFMSTHAVLVTPLSSQPHKVGSDRLMGVSPAQVGSGERVRELAVLEHEKYKCRQPCGEAR